MYCPECGKQIVDDAKFCSYCGASIGLSSKPVTKEEWEYCEIQYEEKKIYPDLVSMLILTTKWKVTFWAKAIGKNGVFNAGESETFIIGGMRSLHDITPPFGNNKKEQQISHSAHENLIQTLIKKGWEPTGERGPHLWQTKLKRRVA